MSNVTSNYITRNYISIKEFVNDIKDPLEELDKCNFDKHIEELKRDIIIKNEP